MGPGPPSPLPLPRCCVARATTQAARPERGARARERSGGRGVARARGGTRGRTRLGVTRGSNALPLPWHRPVGPSVAREPADVWRVASGRLSAESCGAQLPALLPRCEAQRWYRSSAQLPAAALEHSSHLLPKCTANGCSRSAQLLRAGGGGGGAPRTGRNGRAGGRSIGGGTGQRKGGVGRRRRGSGWRGGYGLCTSPGRVAPPQWPRGTRPP